MESRIKRNALREIILTGPVNIGKTTVLSEVVSLAKDRNLKVGGVIKPDIKDRQGRRIGYKVVDVETEEWMVLATVCDDGKKTPIITQKEIKQGFRNRETDNNTIRNNSKECDNEYNKEYNKDDGKDDRSSVVFSSYEFFPKAIDFANTCLKKVADNLNNYHLVVIDEIGYLEMKGGGFKEALNIVSKDFSGCRIVIVRDSVVESFVSAMGGIFQVVYVNNENRNALSRQLFFENVL